MNFNSAGYFVLLPTVLLLLRLLRSLAPQRLLLLAVSYFFYAQWDWRFTALLAGITLWTHACVTQMGRHEGAKRRLWLTVNVAGNLATLAVFKYANFFLEPLRTLLHGVGVPLGILQILLPVGISFIVFEVIAYSVEVYRRNNEFEPNLGDLALLVAFFPHLVAGPILRPNEFLSQFRRPLVITFENVSAGVQLFGLGLAKKLVVADRLAVSVDAVFAHPSSFSPTATWLVVVSYALQIYADFSGYSDMAIGSAKCMGIDISRNFDNPYFARDLSDFWRRWHISLSSWLRNYLYIPFGGNRRGELRTQANLMIVMILGGLWHGANWTFMAWGALHGLGLVAVRAWKGRGFRAFPGSRFLGMGCTFLFVLLAWVPFRSPDAATMVAVFSRLCGIGATRIDWVPNALLIAGPAMLLADGASACWYRGQRLDLTRFTHQLAFFLGVIGILVMAAFRSNPFIYFRF